MSLDFSLVTKCEHCGHTEYHLDVNITHNLGKMADAAGIYKALWHPETIEATKAGDLITTLRGGLAKLKARPTYFSTYNAPNGWGKYENFVPFVEKVLQACEEHPEATIDVSV